MKVEHYRNKSFLIKIQRLFFITIYLLFQARQDVACYTTAVGGVSQSVPDDAQPSGQRDIGV